ncbi:MAG: methyltransferase domain-containing protein [Pseudomonadota bacterium]
MATPPDIFDRRRYAQNRSRAAKTLPDHDFLHRRAMADIVDRLETVKRTFSLGAMEGAGAFVDMLTPACAVQASISIDLSPRRLPILGGLVADMEALPLAPQSLDLFVSLLTLHTANDLVGALTQARMALKPDGLFIAAVFGEDTLSNLRHALYAAETEVTGGVAPRIAPAAVIQDYGAALQRAGFALPVIDIDKFEVSYQMPLNLLKDLRGMGETNVLKQKSPPLRREALARALSLFERNGGLEKFEIVYLTGWAPHQSQQKPLQPGSAQMSMKDAIKGAR